MISSHDDVITSKHFPRYWSFVWGIRLSPVNSPHKGQWCDVLMFSLICAWINGWVNNCEAGDLRCHHAYYYDVTVMTRKMFTVCTVWCSALIWWWSILPVCFRTNHNNKEMWERKLLLSPTWHICCINNHPDVASQNNEKLIGKISVRICIWFSWKKGKMSW